MYLGLKKASYINNVKTKKLILNVVTNMFNAMK